MKSAAVINRSESTRSKGHSNHRSRPEPFFSSGKSAADPFFGSSVLQPKLKIGRKDDNFEREANTVADRVMMMPDLDEEENFQLKPAGEEENLKMQPEEGDEHIDMQPAEKEESLQMQAKEEEYLQSKPLLQAGDGGGMSASPELAFKVSSTKGTGSPLDPGIQREMGSKMGADFSGVNIHTGHDASAMSSEIGARAFTVGSDIYFNKGQYEPHTSSGKHLLAHELTHTVQQLGSEVIQRQIENDVRQQWGFRIKGSVTLSQGDQTVSRRLTQPTIIIEMPRSADGILDLQMRPRWYRWRRTFRWSDPRKDFNLVPSWTYEASWNIRIEHDRLVINFANDSNRTHEINPRGLPRVKLFEMLPGATGSSATVKVTGFGRDGSQAETILIFNVTQPLPDVEIGPISIQRTLVLRDFGISRAELTSQHIRQIDEFWDSLSPATQRAIEHNRKLSGENVRVYGFTSTTDRIQNNFWLSGERARTVARALMLKSGNQNLDNISVIARGEFPEATDDPEREREEGNYRAVVVVLWDIQE